MPRLSSFNDGYSSEIQRQIGINPEYKNSIMLFCQGAAPTGWVRDTTDDDHMLRITNGSTISTGGTSPFRAVLSTADQTQFSGGPANLSVATGGWNLTTDQIPRHTHNYATLREQLSQEMVSPGNISGPDPPSTVWPPYRAYDVFYLEPMLRPRESAEPISGTYPTTNPYENVNSYGGAAGYQYKPGRFKDAGSGGSHTHTTGNSTITWKGYWDMRVKYIDAMFAKYTG